MRFALLVFLLLFPCLCTAEDWGALRFLIGNWTGEGGGAPGQGSGGFSFQPDLQGRVLVRKNRAEYPATKDRPAFTHDDLMIVYRDPEERSDGALKAMYFDSEGHVIRYAVTMFGDRVVFTTEPGQAGPNYRLTYERSGADGVRIKFEIASPGKAFTSYIDAVAKRAR